MKFLKSKRAFSIWKNSVFVRGHNLSEIPDSFPRFAYLYRADVEAMARKMK